MKKSKKSIKSVFVISIMAIIIIAGCIIKESGKRDVTEMQANESLEVKQTERVSEIDKEETVISDVVPLETKEDLMEERESIEQENLPVWVTASNVNLRSRPNTDCEVLQKLSRNTELILKYEKDGWGAVIYGGLEGYVSMEYLTQEEPTTNGFIVVIDPGHQEKGDNTKEPNGPDSAVMKARVTGGTKGCATGVMEYELNLEISLQLREELETRGYTVFMTRETHDVNISNMERAQYAASVDADISVRIHANGVENASVSGALALAPSAANSYVSSLSLESQNLGKCILDAYCAATGMNNQGVVLSDTMTGINWSMVPVTILEMGYMTNVTDDTNMNDSDYQKKMVQGIANGIDDFFHIANL